MALVLPWAELSEQAVLGAMLADATVVPRVQRLIGAEDFYKAGHRHLFTAVAALATRGEVPDLGTVMAELDRAGAAGSSGGRAYVAGLVDSLVTLANVEVHAAQVAEMATRRRLIQLGQALAHDAGDPGADSAVLAGEAMSALVPVAAKATRGRGFVRVGDDRAGLVAELTAPPPADGLVGVPTGWPAVDVMSGGYIGGELVVFAAVPGGGKTVALINIATYNTVRASVPRPGAFISAEMTRRALQKRILCDLAEIDTVTMRKRTFNDMQGHRLSREMERLLAAPLWIDETPTPDVPTMFAKLRALKAEVPDLAFACVDYLQLVRSTDEENRAEELRAISYGLKGLAKELDLPLFTAAQVNDKQTEKRPEGGKRPRPDDLQGSSGPRQAADVVATLHRPKLYGDAVTDTVEMMFGKNRELPTVMVTLEAELEYQRIIPARLTIPYASEDRTAA